MSDQPKPPAKKGNNGGGRPSFQPTQQQRNQVQILKANGSSLHIIAQIVGCDENTLTKHFKAELKYGKERAIATMGAAVFRMATQGNISAARFWLRCHGGLAWKEKYPDAEASYNQGNTTIIIKGGLPPTIEHEPDEDSAPKLNGSNGLDHSETE